MRSGIRGILRPVTFGRLFRVLARLLPLLDGAEVYLTKPLDAAEVLAFLDTPVGSPTHP